MSYFQKDINTLQALDLPDTYLKEGDFLRVKTDGSGDVEWFDTDTGNIVIGTALVGNGSVSTPSIAFSSDKNTGIYRLGEDDFGITTGGVTRMAIDGTSIEVGTLSNNLNLNVNGTTTAKTFMAGDGTNSTPSYAFSNTQGGDTGLYYTFDSIDRLRLSAGGSFVQELNAGQCFYNVRLLCNNSAATNSVPAIIFHNDSSTTGYSGQRVSASTDPRLWAIVNGVQSTELTPTQFNIGLNNNNNTNMKTLNHNGASNFNSYNQIYQPIVQNQTAATGYSGPVNVRSVCTDGTNYVFTTGTTTAGQVRVAVTSNFTSFTQFNDTPIPLASVTQSDFGNGYFVVLQTTSITRNYCFSTSANVLTTWTRVDNATPWAISTQVNFVRFLNGQFLCGTNNGNLRFCTNPSLASNWTEVDITPTQSDGLFDIAYSPQLRTYVIVTSTSRIWYWVDTLNTGITAASSFISVNVHRSKGITWSPKLSMFLMQDDTTGGTPLNTNRFSYSKNGTTWTTYISSVQNFSGAAATGGLSWINDYGVFMVTQSLSGNNQYAFSRDGINWSFTQNNISMTSINSLYDSINKRLVCISTTTTPITFKNLSTEYASYVDPDALYNTFNSNVRFDDVMEYKNQVITTSSSDNHYTVSSLNKSEIIVDTTNANFNLYLQGASFNGRVGTKFKIIKNNNNNNVRIHGYETTTLISPTGNVSSFNAQSSPQVYSIISAGYFGSFEISRVSDSSNGVWVIDNVDVYDSTGTVRQIGNLNIAGNLTVNGTIINPIEDIRDITWPAPATGFDIDNTNIETLGKYNYFISAGNDPIIYLDNLNVSAYNNLTFNFVRHPSATTTGNYVIRNAMGGSNLVLVYCNGTMNILTSVPPVDVITIDKDQWCRCTYKHNWISGNNYWVVHQYNSNV